MDEKFHGLAKSIGNLQKEAVKQTLLVCEHAIDRIVSSGSKDPKAIEHTLDALCEVAFDEDVLFLFKKLCRYYYNINSIATAEYVYIYRNMWGSGDENNTD